MARLSEEFVCVRIVDMKGVDLDLFRFDYDLTLAILFLDGNDRIYSRYGGRDAGGADDRLSKESLLHSMRTVLKVHKEAWKGPDDRKERLPPEVTVEDLPGMKKRIATGKRPDCFHCHMVVDSRRQWEIDRGTFDKRKIWDYPLPENLGIALQRDQGTLVASVDPKSPAGKGDLRKGDRIHAVDGVRTISEGDVRWALHNFGGRKLKLTALRAGEVVKTRLSLPKGWRKSDISWRESMYHIPPKPGFWAPPAKEGRRAALGIPSGVLALDVQWVPGGPARRAGLRKGMVIVAVDGSRRERTCQQVQLFIKVNKSPGDSVVLTVLDGGRERDLVLRFPKPTGKY